MGGPNNMNKCYNDNMNDNNNNPNNNHTTNHNDSHNNNNNNVGPGCRTWRVRAPPGRAPGESPAYRLVCYTRIYYIIV